MKIALFLLLFSFLSVSFGQNSILESGTWCGGDLKLTATLEAGTTLTGWKKDGELLAGETGLILNCNAYGKGNYSAIILTADVTSSIAHDLTSTDGPTAIFSGTNYPAAGVTFFADASTSVDPIATWSWDFGNGTTSNDQNPRIFFGEQKDYLITLTVTTASGCAHTIVQTHNWSY